MRSDDSDDGCEPVRPVEVSEEREKQKRDLEEKARLEREAQRKTECAL